MNTWSAIPFWGIIFAVMASLMKISLVWAIDGEPGIDYPAYSAVPPRLQFSCKDRIPGYYADTETQCQVWHWCVPGGKQFSFLCPNATVFNQNYRVCDWWYNVECATSENLYKINEDLYKDADGNLI